MSAVLTIQQKNGQCPLGYRICGAEASAICFPSTSPCPITSIQVMTTSQYAAAGIVNSILSDARCLILLRSVANDPNEWTFKSTAGVSNTVFAAKRGGRGSPFIEVTYGLDGQVCLAETVGRGFAGPEQTSTAYDGNCDSNTGGVHA